MRGPPSRGAPGRQIVEIDIERTAHHEAAHAIADTKFGFKFLEVTIERHGDALGESYCDGDCYDDEDVTNRITSLLSGYAADIKFSPETGESARWGASSDFESAEEMIGDTAIDPWIERAKVFVDENWKAIALVASELLKEKKLEFVEVDILIDVAEGKDEMSTLEEYRRRRDWVPEGIPK